MLVSALIIIGIVLLLLGNTMSKMMCQFKGGHWRKWGMLQSEYCQIPAKDAQHSCTDGSQCFYKQCLADDMEATQGKCAMYRHNFGCNARIKNGKNQGIICID